ncbi:MAG: hypothetical protein ABI831_18695 [Betaproteobacteria bacterium]
MNLAALTLEEAKAMEGTVFDVQLPDGGRIPLKLFEVLPFETGQRRLPRGTKPKRAPFSLYFLGPVAPALPQGMFTFHHNGESVQNLFIVPIGQDAEATEYEAVFN